MSQLARPVYFNSNQGNAVSGTIIGTGAGQILINGSTSFDIAAAGAVFNFATDQLFFQNSASINGPGVLTNVGDVNGSPVFKTKVLNTGTLTPTGTVTFTGANAELRILAGSIFSSTGVGLAGDATSVGLIVESGGVLSGSTSTGAVPVQVLGGTVKTGTSSSVYFIGATSLIGAHLDTTAGGQIVFQGGSTTTLSGVLDGTGPAGTVTFGNGVADLNIAAGGAILNFPDGMATFSQATINGPGTLTNTGDLNGSPIIATKVLNTGTFTPAGTVTFTGANAELRILAGGVFSSTGVGLTGTATSVGLIVESGGVLSGGISTGARSRTGGRRHDQVGGEHAAVQRNGQPYRCAD